jgi:deoxyribodipyrimidine photo-lyase
VASTAVVVFTRDLRVRDHRALGDARRTADRVVPLFVFDDAILASPYNTPNRTGFLLDALHDLDGSLRARGTRLSVRRGDWVDEVLTVAHDAGAASVHVSRDVSGYAQRRLDALETAAADAGIEVRPCDGITVVPPGALTPTGGDHYKVFTPYYRRWRTLPLPPRPSTPRAIPGPARRVAAGRIPGLDALVRGARAPDLPAGGERAARRRLSAWARRSLHAYGDGHDDLAGDRTSHLSADLHFGCVSAADVVRATRDRAGGEPFVRQVCWRDFFHQVLAARPDAAGSDYRPRRGRRWRDDPEGFAAWCEGRTGYPLVDAGMRQLLAEGWMHNRARLVAASFLTHDLGIDWRRGARHFLDHLVDGDVANNNLSWQWMAGTGNDTDPRRVLSPTRQAQRFDRDGAYVRRYVPELAGVDRRAIHDPDDEARAAAGYPPPIRRRAPGRGGRGG